MPPRRSGMHNNPNNPKLFNNNPKTYTIALTARVEPFRVADKVGGHESRANCLDGDTRPSGLPSQSHREELNERLKKVSKIKLKTRKRADQHECLPQLVISFK